MTAQTVLKYTVNLNKGLVLTPIPAILATEDDAAHTFIVSAVKDGEPQRFTGADVRGFFIRPDSVTVPINGTVDEEGNAIVTLTARCYAIAGRFQLAIRIVQGDVKSVIFCGDGSLRKVSTDAFIDEEGIIPSLDELLAQIATIEGAVNNANTAADNADKAADRAIAAAERAENAKGDTGATPNLTIGTVETLDAGSNATATITGTAEEPVLNLGVPKGYDGVGAVLSVNGKTGEVELSASDVGAATWETVYPVGAVYISANSTSPASLFGGSWEQIKERFLFGAGDTYTAGGTGGEFGANHKHLTRFGYDGQTFYGLEGNGTVQNNVAGAFVNKSNITVTNTIYRSYTDEVWLTNMPPYLNVYMWKRTA